MGILSRFADIMKANINDLLDKCEDPAKMVDQTLRNLREQLADVKKETAAVMAEEARCERVMDEAEDEVEKWTEYAKKALIAGNEGDAKQFLAKKQSAQTKFLDAKALYETAHVNAENIRKMHDKLVTDINDLNARREQIKAKIAVTKTQETINKATSSIDVGGTMAAFDSIEARVNKRFDEAQAMANLNAKPVDETEALADKYANGADSASVDAELAALKAEMGIQ